MGQIKRKIKQAAGHSLKSKITMAVSPSMLQSQIQEMRTCCSVKDILIHELIPFFIFHMMTRLYLFHALSNSSTCSWMLKAPAGSEEGGGSSLMSQQRKDKLRSGKSLITGSLVNVDGRSETVALAPWEP